MAYRSSYGGSRRGRSSSSYRSNAGREAAKKHVREAAQLSRELGGTDQDVKDYFFGLRGAKLKSVLDEYGKKYGKDVRQYAEETLPQWRSGHRRMSGRVAERLFSLLPRHMPVSKKYELVESLWKFKGPSSSRTIYVGPEADASELTSMVREHFNAKVKSYTIDATISKRFDWLAENDSKLCQDLKNHFLHLEKKQLTAASFDRIGIMLEQIQRTETLHQTLKQIFEVGKHKVELQFSPESKGISDQAPKQVYAYKSEAGSSSSSVDNNLGWIIMIAVVVIAFILKNMD